MDPAEPYVLLARLGEGGMAEVFKAVKRGPDGWEKPIALKRILPHLADNPDFIRMLSTEARLHAHLDHPNIVQILDFFRFANSFMIALEYVPGRNLRQVLLGAADRGLSLPCDAALFIATEVLKALDYAHKRRGGRGPLNIVHRDVNPHNVLLAFDGFVKLSDFGIARANIGRERTRSGLLKGKCRYLAPEQLRHTEVDHRADIFSAGVLLHEMLCGHHPFDAASEFETMERISKGRFEPLSSLRPDLPEGISEAVLRAMATDPGERFGDASSFREALLSAQGPEWLGRGTERMHAFMAHVYPKPTDRKDEAIEKTPVLSLSGTPLPDRFSPDESLIAEVPAYVSATTRRISPARGIRLGAFLLVVAASALIVWLFPSRTSMPPPPPVELTPGAEAPVTVPPEPTAAPQPPTRTPPRQAPKKAAPAVDEGFLSVSGISGSIVYVNGKEVGQLPMEDIRLPAGEYLIAVSPPKGPLRIGRILVETGKRAAYRYGE